MTERHGRATAVFSTTLPAPRRHFAPSRRHLGAAQGDGWGGQGEGGTQMQDIKWYDDDAGVLQRLYLSTIPAAIGVGSEDARQGWAPVRRLVGARGETVWDARPLVANGGGGVTLPAWGARQVMHRIAAHRSAVQCSCPACFSTDSFCSGPNGEA